MAVLDVLPEQQIIDGFKGVLDFYLWKGIPVARKWPVWMPRIPTPTEATNQQAFSYINKLWKDLPPNIKQTWNDMASDTSLTGKDLSVRAYMQGRD